MRKRGATPYVVIGGVLREPKGTEEQRVKEVWDLG